MEKPSPRYVKHGWLRDNEYNQNLHNFGATMDERNIKTHNPLTTYYTPEEMEIMRQEIQIAECPICFEEINDNRCRVCINGHKFHNICPTLPNNEAVTICPSCKTQNIFLCGLSHSKYNDITSGGKKSKRKNKITMRKKYRKKINRKSGRIRKSRKH
jgi:hypothetical protein